jgi:hypothetical protein
MPDALARTVGSRPSGSLHAGAPAAPPVLDVPPTPLKPPVLTLPATPPLAPLPPAPPLIEPPEAMLPPAPELLPPVLVPPLPPPSEFSTVKLAPPHPAPRATESAPVTIVNQRMAKLLKKTTAYYHAQGVAYASSNDRKIKGL